MAVWALFWQPQRFHKLCEALEFNGCTVRRLPADFTKFTADPESNENHEFFFALSRFGNSLTGDQWFDSSRWHFF
jgi:hypothetical protein